MYNYTPTFVDNNILKKIKQEDFYSIGDDLYEFFTITGPKELNFEEREGQLDMAYEILEAMNKEEHIIVEAGVGIGKSFAYLVPLLLFNNLYRKPVVIATSTIALQEQLYKDVQYLQEKLNVSCDVLLAKGQNNYVCREKAESFLIDHKDDFSKDILRNIRENKCQERKSFPFKLKGTIWEKICVSGFDKCKKCIYLNTCEYKNLRKNLLKTSGIIICNQDMLTVHLLKLSHGENGLLNPNIKYIVIDEAHNLEDKVRSATTRKLKKNQIIQSSTKALNAVDPTTRNELQYLLQEVIDNTNALFNECSNQINIQTEEAAKRFMKKERFDLKDLSLLSNTVSSIISLEDEVQTLSFYNNSEKRKSATFSDDLSEITNSVSVLNYNIQNYLVWIEKHEKTIQIMFCPKNTSNIINSLYFSNPEFNTFLTSATLTSSTSGNLENQYSYLLKNTGFPVAEGKGVLSDPKQSPFPYDEHAMIYYCDDLPNYRNNHEEFMVKAAERLIDLLNISHGRALILFTAKTDMEEIYSLLIQRNLPYQIYIQAEGSSQNAIIEKFKDDVDSVLLGTGIYWEGINIEGKSLSNVVIFRLPFPVPDPIIEYKNSISKDSLMEVAVPEMIIKLKQGIGRLIRNDTDKGIISIIDPRLKDNNPAKYRDMVWESLPIKNRTNKLETIRNFYRSVCG